MSFTTSDNEQLQKLMKESPEYQPLIQKLLDSQQYTISKISHEIRNPLALIYSTIQLIESQHPEAKTFQYWDELHHDIEFTISLLSDLSTFNNGETLHKRSISSYEFLSRICLSFAASVMNSGIEFTSSIPQDLPLIFADSVKLREVILNLLKNARESLDTCGQITLSSYVANDTLYIEITDTGCGIPSEHLETLFDAFVTHKTEGTGLGLSIAKRIVEAHGGSIRVTSQPAVGSTFQIALPVA